MLMATNISPCIFDTGITEIDKSVELFGQAYILDLHDLA